MTETPLEMCQRHVVEGAERIARQKSLIARLVHDGHEHMVPEARILLDNLETAQQLGKEHLAREIAKSEAAGVEFIGVQLKADCADQ